MEGGLPAIHDQRVVVAEARLSAEYAFRDEWAISVALPWRLVDAHIRVVDPAGNEIVSPEPSPHHRNETLSGIGDMQVAVRWAGGFAGGRTIVEGRAGVTLPFGRTEDDPFVRENEPHQHIQFGSGTVNPVLAAEATRRFTAPMAWRAGVWGFTQQGIYESAKGYHPGDKYAAGLTAGSTLGARRFDFSASFELHAETAERWGGIVHDDEGNAGRMDLLLGAGASFAPTASTRLFLAVRIPLYTDVVGAQLDYPFIGAIGFSASFDVAARARKPVPPAPAPVAGKITVVDYAATWCAPCAVLERELTAVAARHPGRLEIRKVDVSDADLDWELPHIQVYGVDGALLFERSGTPEDLAAAVEEWLRIDQQRLNRNRPQPRVPRADGL